MPRDTKYRIEPTTPAGWYKVVNKDTGACMDSVKGYAAALESYRRFNRDTAKIAPMPRELRAESPRSAGAKARTR